MVAPRSWARLTAARPTPPAAAWIRTVWPGRRAASASNAYSAVRKATGTAAASSKESSGGLRTTRDAGTVTKERKEPGANPITGSPTRNSRTPGPTVRTTPAPSSPRGPASPGYRPSVLRTSRKLRPVARSSISTSPGPGARRSCGRSVRLSSKPRSRTKSSTAWVGPCAPWAGESQGTSRAARLSPPRCATSSSASAERSSSASASASPPGASGSRSIARQRAAGFSRATTARRPQRAAWWGCVTPRGPAAWLPRVTSTRVGATPGAEAIAFARSSAARHARRAAAWTAFAVMCSSIPTVERRQVHDASERPRRRHHLVQLLVGPVEVHTCPAGFERPREAGDLVRRVPDEQPRRPTARRAWAGRRPGATRPCAASRSRVPGWLVRSPRAPCAATAGRRSAPRPARPPSGCAGRPPGPPRLRAAAVRVSRDDRQERAAGARGRPRPAGTPPRPRGRTPDRETRRPSSADTSRGVPGETRRPWLPGAPPPGRRLRRAPRRSRPRPARPRGIGDRTRVRCHRAHGRRTRRSRISDNRRFNASRVLAGRLGSIERGTAEDAAARVRGPDIRPGGCAVQHERDVAAAGRLVEHRLERPPLTVGDRQGARHLEIGDAERTGLLPVASGREGDLDEPGRRHDARTPEAVVCEQGGLGCHRSPPRRSSGAAPSSASSPAAGGPRPAASERRRRRGRRR